MATNPYDMSAKEMARIPMKTEDYHRCILKHMKGIGSDVAATRISEACMALGDK
jgi:hypothetical protein